MTATAVAHDVDDDVLVEGVAVLEGQVRATDDGLGVVCVHVQDRDLQALGQVGRVSGRAALRRAGREADLVIDDDVRMLKVIKLHLHEKYDVATAISGKIALKFLETKHTDLILLDYAMPDENGLVVLEKLRANPLTKDIPVIFLTGITDRKKIQEALVMKPQGYLLKPINRKRLLAAIQNTLEA